MAKPNAETAGEPKRYMPGYEVDESSRGIRLVMDQIDTGDFVRFSDHDRIVATLQRENAELHAKLEEAELSRNGKEFALNELYKLLEYLRTEFQKCAEHVEQCNAELEKAANRMNEQTVEIYTLRTQLDTQLAQARDEALTKVPFEPEAQCAHKNRNQGYEKGYDISWCDDCGIITGCSDGLISASEAKRNDRSKWCESHVVAFGCAREARGRLNAIQDGKLCTQWCGQSYCAVSLRALKSPNSAEGEPG